MSEPQRMIDKRILIVEDESIVQLHLSRIVKGMGCTVTGLASSADEALNCAAGDRPDLVLMDIHLRGDVDGIEAAKLLRAKYDVGIVFVTAYADDKTVENTSGAGAIGYIVKPFSEREVRAVIATAVAEHERARGTREREKSLASILHSLGDAVFVLDADQRVTFMNPRAAALSPRSMGLQADQVIGVCDEDKALFKGTIERALQTGQSQALSTMSVLRPDGSDVAMEGQVEPLDGPDESAAGLIVSLRELTSRWNTEARVDQARRPGHARMLIYSHDTFGLGHLRRCLNLSWALTRKHENLSVLVVTGSTVAHRYKLPPRVDYVKLPAVRKVASESYESRSLMLDDDGVLKIRSNLLLRTVRDFEPDLLLVDHSPVGMRAELLPALEWLQNNRQDCVKILGLRDIIDEPESLIDSWTHTGIYDVLDKLYDHVVVYGSREFFDPVAAYRFPPEIASRTKFLNYVAEDEGAIGPEEDRLTGRKSVVVTVGGGDGAAELVIGNYLEMVEKYRARIDFDTVILPGPLAPPEVVERYRKRCEGLPVVIHDFVESTSPYMRQSDLVICTGGYNTTVQVLCNARRCVIIPRMMHRREQWLRASLLAELKVVELIDPENVSPELLFDTVTAQLTSEGEPLVDARANKLFRFDGAEAFADLCATFIARDSLTQESGNDGR